MDPDAAALVWAFDIEQCVLLACFGMFHNCFVTSVTRLHPAHSPVERLKCGGLNSDIIAWRAGRVFIGTRSRMQSSHNPFGAIFIKSSAGGVMRDIANSSPPLISRPAARREKGGPSHMPGPPLTLVTELDGGWVSGSVKLLTPLGPVRS